MVRKSRDSRDRESDALPTLGLGSLGLAPTGDAQGLGGSVVFWYRS